MPRNYCSSGTLLWYPYSMIVCRFQFIVPILQSFKNLKFRFKTEMNEQRLYNVESLMDRSQVLQSRLDSQHLYICQIMSNICWISNRWANFETLKISIIGIWINWRDIWLIKLVKSESNKSDLLYTQDTVIKFKFSKSGKIYHRIEPLSRIPFQIR